MDLERLYRSTKRGLFIILTLSCIGSGFSFLTNLITGLTYPVYKAMYESGDLLEMMMRFSGEQDGSIFEAALEQSMAVPRVVYLLHALLYAMSLAGVIMMYRLHKNGCHLYAIAQLLVLIVTLLFLGKGHLIIGDVMMALLFIVYYFVTFRRIGQLQEALAQQATTPESPEETPQDNNSEQSEK